MSSTPTTPELEPQKTDAPPPPDSDGPDLTPRPLDLESPQFTVRAVLTGMVLAALLSVCNVYAGLKVGWSFNMSIVAALASYGLWQGLHFGIGTRKWGILENNINQTACSSGASVSSAGLVAPIPALALLTGQTLDWHFLALWCFSVMLVGITVAIAIRRQMLITDKLPYAYGIASAETLKQMYADGGEAMMRLGMLLFGAIVAGRIQLMAKMGEWYSAIQLGGWWKAMTGTSAIKGYSMKSLGFALDPSLLFYGVGGLIGIRAGVSMLIGAIIGFGVLSPYMIDENGARLEAKVTVKDLPKEVVEQFPKQPEGFLTYKASRNQLTHAGVMTTDERDKYLAIYDNEEYQAGVRELFVASQLSVVRANEALVDSVYEVDQTASPAAINKLGDAAAVAAAAETNLTAPSQAYIDKLQEAMARGNELSAEERDEYLALAAGIETKLNDSIRDVYVASQPEVQEARAGLATAVAAVDGEADAASVAAPAPGFSPLVKWLLWPGVTLMVVSSLVSFAFSWRSVLAAFGMGGKRETAQEETGEVSRGVFFLMLVAVLALSVYLQVSFFAIVLWAAVAGVLLTFVLALVAARVAGETSITPVGAMGKVTQLFFGALIPGQVAPNLMAANVTGGAASQCADLLHDMRCGFLIGASPRLQALAQICGAFAGAMAGSAVYLLLINNPEEQLLTPEWPGPAVVTWKAVAELFAVGWEALPEHAMFASGIAIVIGILFPILEKTLPKKAAGFVPSAASIGLALVVPANYALTMFAGALIAWVVSKIFKKWSARFMVTLCAGIVAGDTLVGAGWGIFQQTDWADIYQNIVAQLNASSAGGEG